MSKAGGMSKQRRVGTTQSTRHRPVNTTSTKIINPNRPVDKNNSHLRSKDTIKRLALMKAKPVRDSQGRLIHGELMSTRPDEKSKRIKPDRKWFGTSLPCLFGFFPRCAVDA